MPPIDVGTHPGRLDVVVVVDRDVAVERADELVGSAMILAITSGRYDREDRKDRCDERETVSSHLTTSCSTLRERWMDLSAP